jgi:hypothetical protein
MEAWEIELLRSVRSSRSVWEEVRVGIPTLRSIFPVRFGSRIYTRQSGLGSRLEDQDFWTSRARAVFAILSWLAERTSLGWTCKPSKTERSRVSRFAPRRGLLAGFISQSTMPLVRTRRKMELGLDDTGMGKKDARAKKGSRGKHHRSNNEDAAFLPMSVVQTSVRLRPHHVNRAPYVPANSTERVLEVAPIAHQSRSYSPPVAQTQGIGWTNGSRRKNPFRTHRRSGPPARVPPQAIKTGLFVSRIPSRRRSHSRGARSEET